MRLMGQPSADELLTKSPSEIRSVSGIFVDEGARQSVKMRFAWKHPDRWSWFHFEPPLSGVVTDGTTKVVVDEGTAAIVTTQGRVNTTHRLRSLLDPRLFDMEGWDNGPVRAGEACGREAWLFHAEAKIEGKETTEIAIDSDTGIMLFMRSPNRYLGFEEIEIGQPMADEVFTWRGPTEERPIGTAFVSRLPGQPWHISWQVSARRRFVFDMDSPSFEDVEDARAWASDRALKVVVRDDT